MSSGFENYDTKTLLITYGNLVGGIDKIADILEADHRDGTTNFTDSPKDTKGGTPPAQFGTLILWLLQSVATELLTREVPLPRTKEKR